MHINIEYDEEMVEVRINEEMYLFEPVMSTGEIVDNLDGILGKIPNLIIEFSELENAEDDE